MTKPLTAQYLCDCHECGSQVFVSYDDNGPDGLIHKSIAPSGQYGPNGETGCSAFDAVGQSSPDDFADYVKTCREKLEQKDFS